MSSISSLNRSVLRITGLSSTLDTDSIVTGLLTTDKSRIDKQFQVKTKLEWKADAYREMNTLLKNFRQENLSTLKASTNMLSSTALKMFNVTMLDTSSAVTVSAGTSASEGTYTINEISQLAKAAVTTNTDTTGVFSSDIAYDTALQDLSFNNAIQFDENNAITFSINGKDFSFTKDNTVGDVINTINSSDAGVTMKYSSLTKNFTITSKTTGAASEVNIVNKTGNAFATDGAAFKIAQGVYNGQNAKLKIEGVDVEKDTNSFTIDGITYTLKGESTTPVSFTIDKDIDGIVDKVKNFISNYNTMIDTLQTRIDEETYKSYPPLTDDQREQLTETQQKKWDDFSKSGLLRNDSNISGLLNKMRSAFYTDVEGTGVSPSELGLNTGIYSDHGKITIDEDKLRAAIENNPDLVTKVFTQSSTATDASQKFKESGLINRISIAMNEYTATTTDVNLKNLDDEIDDADEYLTTLQTRYDNNEEKYYARFTAMETALAKLNSQQSWLGNQISSFNS